jgi:hypothetical protein
MGSFALDPASEDVVCKANRAFEPRFVNRCGAVLAISCLDAGKTLLTKKLYHLTCPGMAGARHFLFQPRWIAFETTRLIRARMTASTLAE